MCRCTSRGGLLDIIATVLVMALIGVDAALRWLVRPFMPKKQTSNVDRLLSENAELRRQLAEKGQHTKAVPLVRQTAGSNLPALRNSHQE